VGAGGEATEAGGGYRLSPSGPAGHLPMNGEENAGAPPALRATSP